MHLGIDIGGTKVALAYRNADGVEQSVSFRWPDPAELATDISSIVEGIKLIDVYSGGPVTIGIATPPTVDASGLVAAWPNRPHWVGANLLDVLDSVVPGADFHYADDGDLAALAEATASAYQNAVYLGVGTGIGGGIISGGEIFPGVSIGSCEIGHVVIDRQGPLCECGRRGCLQAVASGRATHRRARRLRGEDLTEAQFHEAIDRRETWALGVVEETAHALATAAINLGELVHPDVVIVGGGFASAIEGLVPRVAEIAQTMSRTGIRTPPVQAARLGGLSSLQGALMLACDKARQV